MRVENEKIKKTMKNVLRSLFMSLGMPIEVVKRDKNCNLVGERFVGKYVYGIDDDGIVRYRSKVLDIQSPCSRSCILVLGTGHVVKYSVDKVELMGIGGTCDWGHLFLAEDEETESMKYWQSHSIPGFHIIVGKNSKGDIQYKSPIDGCTSYFHNNGNTGEVEEFVSLQLTDGNTIKWDILSNVLIPQWENAQKLKYEIVPLKEVNISYLPDGEIMGLTVIGTNKYEDVKFRAEIDKCNTHYGNNYVTDEPQFIVSLHFSNGATAKWDFAKEVFIPLDGCPERLDYKVVETL